MDLYNLGQVSWWESQCYYHALAELGREGLILCYPATPYICLGLHDDLEQEIDLDYCHKSGLPLLRRETGGGVVYLDHKQLFYQLVLRRENPLIPLRRERFYLRVLEPAIQVYRQLGLPVEWRAPADLVFRGAKCSGNGAGEIGQGVVFVGNLLMDFDFDVMADALKTPHRIYRDLLRQSMRNNMCTLSDYNPKLPSYERVAALITEAFEPLLGQLIPATPDNELRQEALRSYERLTHPEWLALPGRRLLNRQVKIAEGVYLHYRHLGEEWAVIALTREDNVEECYLIQGGEVIAQKLFRGQCWSELQRELDRTLIMDKLQAG